MTGVPARDWLVSQLTVRPHRNEMAIRRKPRCDTAPPDSASRGIPVQPVNWDAVRLSPSRSRTANSRFRPANCRLLRSGNCASARPVAWRTSAADNRSALARLAPSAHHSASAGEALRGDRLVPDLLRPGVTEEANSTAVVVHAARSDPETYVRCARPELGPPHVSRERGPPEITPGGSAVAAHPTGDPTEADAPRNETRDNAGSLRGIEKHAKPPAAAGGRAGWPPDSGPAGSVWGRRPRCRARWNGCSLRLNSAPNLE